MPQGVEYDEDYVQSENPVVQAHAIVHGTNPDHTEMKRTRRTAELPEAALRPPGFHSGMGSRGTPYGGSGKGGHDPRGSGDRKGLGAHKADGPDPYEGDMRFGMR